MVNSQDVVSPKVAILSRISFIIALLLGVIAVWIWIIAPQLTKLPKDFSYKADIFSLDNFYDEQAQKFSGEKRSVTKFSYEMAGEKDGILTIKNVFDVRTVTGEKIFEVERLYGIDSKTGQHVAGFDDKTRDGYLFAPRHLKPDQSFTYWHINYDGPAHLTFAGEEKLFGLSVYRYETRYEGVKIDQTENLGSLPGVGVTRGVELEPYLQLWIEPISGHMVKYKDDTVAYYYDLKTGTRQNPWNHFGNTYTRDSVLKQIAIAKSEKLQLTLIETVVPALLALLAFTLLIWIYRKRVALVVLILGIVGLSAFAFSRFYTPADEEVIKIGISRWVPFENKAYDRNVEGFKDALAQAGYREGKNVVYYLETAEADPDRQRAIAQAFKDKDVDLIYSQTTPGTLILKEIIKDRPIVFTIVTYPVETGVIESLKNSGNNLVGTRNWVPVEEQLSVFRELVPTVSAIGFVHRAGEPNSTIQLGEMQRVAGSLGIRVVEIAGKSLPELERALEAASGIDSIFSACDTLVQGEAEDIIIAFARSRKLPSFSCNNTGPFKGDLVGTVADFYEIGKQAGEKAALILSGATPQSLETDTVARPFIYVNQTTARALGITIPQTLLLKVKEIIN